jgi:hypothetical protein
VDRRARRDCSDARGHLPTANVYKGIAESLSLGFVCFGFLAAWLLAAVGMLRRDYLVQDGN